MTDDSLKNWIGREQVQQDRLDPARCNALRAALGGAAGLVEGDPLPALHHWLHFWQAVPQDRTGEDGHPLKGDFLPPIPLPRRMWAGGRLSFEAPLLLGDRIERHSTIRSIQSKTGRSGTMIFVMVEHALIGPRGLAIREEQDLVYRGASVAAPPAEPAAPDFASGDVLKTITADPVLLFRYSALTLNSHRIHYDLPYATLEEGYPQLVVQGPLQATLLSALSERLLNAPLTHFSFRGMAPAYAGSPLDLGGSGDGDAVSVWTGQGGLHCMRASAR